MAKTSSNLAELELKYEMVKLYLWLSMRYPEIFVDRESALSLEEVIEECIDESLVHGPLSHKNACIGHKARRMRSSKVSKPEHTALSLEDAIKEYIDEPSPDMFARNGRKAKRMLSRKYSALSLEAIKKYIDKALVHGPSSARGGRGKRTHSKRKRTAPWHSLEDAVKEYIDESLVRKYAPVRHGAKRMRSNKGRRKHIR